MTEEDKALVQRLRRTYRKEFAATGSMFADNSNRLCPFPILATEVLFNPDGAAAADLIEAQAAEIERMREENLKLRSEMTMIELDSFDAYDDWCLRGLPEEAIGFADRTHQRAKAVLLGMEYDGD
jgi:hypothetical protein